MRVHLFELQGSYTYRVQDALVSERSEARLEELYRANGDRLWRALLGYTGDRDIASDSVAEAFAQALRRGVAIQDPLRWIWRAAFRIAAGELKTRRWTVPGRTSVSDESPDRRLDLTGRPQQALPQAAGGCDPASLRRVSGEGGRRHARFYFGRSEGAPSPGPEPAARALGGTRCLISMSA